MDQREAGALTYRLKQLENNIKRAESFARETEVHLRGIYGFLECAKQDLEQLRKMIIYDQNPRENWYESVVEFFYNDDDSFEFYDNFSESEFEISLFNKVMYQLLHGYHEAVPEDIPTKSGFVLPRSKRI